MYQDLTDRVNQVIDRQDDILDHLKNGASGNGDGNGDSLANSNKNGYSDEPIGISSPPPADPTTYSHQGCGTPLEKMQRNCGGCGQDLVGWSPLGTVTGGPGQTHGHKSGFDNQTPFR